MLKFYTCPQNFWTSLENLQKLNWYKNPKKSLPILLIPQPMPLIEYKVQIQYP